MTTIALTLFTDEGSPLCVVSFPTYRELRQYWKCRRKKMPSFSVERIDVSELSARRSVCVGITPKIGDGYRLLTHEDRAQNGDEWWNSSIGAWEPTCCIGSRPAPTITYRRPTDTMKGYRLLDDGELIRVGDDFSVNGHWMPTSMAGTKVGDKTSIPYRRKQAVLPDYPAGCKVLKADEKIQEGDLYYNGKGWQPVSTSGMQVRGGEGWFIRPM